MAQVFPPGANWFVTWVIFGGGSLALLLGAVATGLYLSPISTRVQVARQQPIPFSHHRHVQGNGIDCRYCHTTVETGAFAGIPPTETCMTCHSQLLVGQEMLEPIHESWRTNEPMEWIRVHDLPDFVYFDHSIHIDRGVGCSTCHGRVDEMRLTRKVETLRMGWCLRCHRAPEKYLRPQDEVFNMEWEPGPDQKERGLELVKARNVKVEQLTDCSICHR